MAVNRDDRYRYALDQMQLDSINDYIAQLIEQHVMRGESGNPIIVSQAVLAYESGTATAVTNIVTQLNVERRGVEETLMSEPYQRRIAYVRARVFEEMKGFTDQTRTDLARVLAESMASGNSPAEIERIIRDRIGVAQSRGMRIARTEINNAHRRAIWDEDQQTNDEGVETRLLWVSALLPTTRSTHASRHGQFYTRAEVEDFYSRNANGINCKCTQVSILVDKNGKLLSDKTTDKLKLQSSQFFQVAAN